MPKAFVSTVINAPLERVWRVVSDFNGLPAWMPGMKDSVIEPGKEDKEVGAVRKLSMTGTKDVLRERLEVLSPGGLLVVHALGGEAAIAPDDDAALAGVSIRVSVVWAVLELVEGVIALDLDPEG